MCMIVNFNKYIRTCILAGIKLTACPRRSENCMGACALGRVNSDIE